MEDIAGDILEEVLGDFRGRSKREPYGILFEDKWAILAKDFLRSNSFERKPRKTKLDRLRIYGSATFPYNLCAVFVYENKKMYGFIYHIGKNGKKGVAKNLNPRPSSFPLLSLPWDMIEIRD